MEVKGRHRSGVVCQHRFGYYVARRAGRQGFWGLFRLPHCLQLRAIHILDILLYFPENLPPSLIVLVVTGWSCNILLAPTILMKGLIVVCRTLQENKLYPESAHRSLTKYLPDLGKPKPPG